MEGYNAHAKENPAAHCGQQEHGRHLLINHYVFKKDRMPPQSGMLVLEFTDMLNRGQSRHGETRGPLIGPTRHNPMIDHNAHVGFQAACLGRIE